MRSHLIIPDCQVTPSSPTDHLKWIGKYIVERQPDVIINLGDFADMESLSFYDRGKIDSEGRRYELDILAAQSAMKVLLSPMKKHNKKMAKWKMKKYRPEMHLTLGNHENRLTRYIEENAIMDGKLSIEDFGYQDHGWNVHPFLDPVDIDGISYSHYFYNTESGRPYGGRSMDTRLKTVGFSFVQGHQQFYMIGARHLNNGDRHRGIVIGACYLHEEKYRGPQSNGEWRGVLVLHEVINGDYSLMEVSLDYLCQRYEGMRVFEFMKLNYPDIYEQSTWMKSQQRNAGGINV